MGFGERALSLGWVHKRLVTRRVVDFAEPKLLVGRIYSLSRDAKELLFKSERTATRNGSTVRVTCGYTYPNGALAARQQIVYEAGRLVSLEEEAFQTGEKGRAIIRPDPKKPGKEQLYFEYTRGLRAEAKQTSASQDLETDTLVDDMIPSFIVSHWDKLAKGAAPRFRYIVISRRETVGFKLSRESETTFQGKPVVRIKMEPTSMLIRQLVDPLFFVVERDGLHRILEYIGRTTPMVKAGNQWKELDAATIFDWQQGTDGAVHQK